ncbi:hypothetical protein [Streptomyces regalis]|uniref:Uncharacterized protein n=1 Tax=Streptomyces regalis TaxID=68262 RepID=A0A101J9W7_9ACTN|nr:hypothetical protein [Streptomyces regalis]KUL22859.1 hypothetical protein ADL12_41160 [Streptomyces regalis]
MIQNDVRSTADDPTWWRAPAVATLLGLPLLVWEYSLWGGNTFRVLGGAVCWAFVLLVVVSAMAMASG